MEAVPQNIPLNVVYEDRDVIVVDKPKGMVVHPAPDTLTAPWSTPCCTIAATVFPAWEALCGPGLSIGLTGRLPG